MDLVAMLTLAHGIVSVLVWSEERRLLHLKVTAVHATAAGLPSAERSLTRLGSWLRGAPLAGPVRALRALQASCWQSRRSLRISSAGSF